MSTYPHLRLVTVDGVQIERCSESNATAASPLGEAVRPLPISLTAEGERPILSPISANVSPPFFRISSTRSAHVIIGGSLRDSVAIMQRHSVTGFPENAGMPHRHPDTPNFSSLGDRIVHWREKRGMTRAQLAKAARIPYSTLAGIETNQQEGTTQLTQIAAALKVNPFYLATDKGNPEDLTVGVAEQSNSAWLLPETDLSDMDDIEMELITLKLQKIVDDVRAKRNKRRGTKVS
jgi:transcriptional regulator with XRE-family HTH domain